MLFCQNTDSGVYLPGQWCYFTRIGVYLPVLEVLFYRIGGFVKTVILVLKREPILEKMTVLTNPCFDEFPCLFPCFDEFPCLISPCFIPNPGFSHKPVF